MGSSLRKVRRTAIALTTVVVIAAVSTAPPAGAYPRPGTTERVSLSSAGYEGSHPLSIAGFTSTRTVMSPDGRYIAFESPLQGLDDRDLNPSAFGDIFWHDRETDRTEIVSVDSLGLPGLPPPTAVAVRNLRPGISANGRFVTFDSDSNTLASGDEPRGDPNNDFDVFRRDLRTGKTELVSGAPNGDAANDYSRSASISGDGRYVAFVSKASNLVAKDTNGVSDIFVKDMETGEIERVSVASDGAQSEAALPTTLGPTNGSDDPMISRTGRWVTFTGFGGNLVDDDTNGYGDIFVHDRNTGKTERVSLAGDGSEGNNPSHLCARISPNGRFVVFCSAAFNLVPNDTNALSGGDVFVRDRKARTTERVSVSSAGEEAQGGSFVASISNNGRYISFNSNANDLTPADTGGWCKGGLTACPLDAVTPLGDIDIFVHDRSTGATILASVAPTSEEGDCDSVSPSLGASGRLVAFSSCASNLVAGDTNEAMDSFVRDVGPQLGLSAIGPAPEKNRGVSLQGVNGFADSGIDAFRDKMGDALDPIGRKGADIVGGRLAYRPGLEDLYVRIDVERLTGDPTIIHGIRFEVGEARYVVRAARLGAASSEAAFGLFRCEADGCAQVATLEGGYGTIGDSIVTAIPLRLCGLSDGGVIEGLEAFSAYGTYSGGSLTELDSATP